MTDAAPKRQSLAPGRLWSLLEMLRENAEAYVTLGERIHDARLIYGINEFYDEASSKLTADGKKEVVKELKMQLQAASRLNLAASTKFIKRLVDDDNPPQTLREYEMVVGFFSDELKTTEFLYIPKDVSNYYEWDSIVSENVADKFPAAFEEIKNGGNCLAIGQFTASVFHAMRAVEIALRALSKSAEIQIKNSKPLDQAEWKELLDGISKFVLAIENRPNSDPNKDADLLFYSEAFAQFRFFKNGWCVRVAHAPATYNKTQAIECLDHVRSFFETLATRFSEN